uniref:Uncharacterized protein n=1 Tax=viral metagenome TaxID=1070528 RepID=A0A6M3LB38_9ZZZZ
MWDIIKVNANSPSSILGFLTEGYEPFAVTTDRYDEATIWMKKEVTNVKQERISKEVPSRTQRRKTDSTAKVSSGA